MVSGQSSSLRSLLTILDRAITSLGQCDCTATAAELSSNHDINNTGAILGAHNTPAMHPTTIRRPPAEQCSCTRIVEREVYFGPTSIGGLAFFVGEKISAYSSRNRCPSGKRTHCSSIEHLRPEDCCRFETDPHRFEIFSQLFGGTIQ